MFTLIINTLLISGKLPIIFSQAWVIPLRSYTAASICYFWNVMHQTLLCAFFSCSVFWAVSSVCSVALAEGGWVHAAVVPRLSAYSLFTRGCSILGSVMCLRCLAAILFTTLEIHNMAVARQYVRLQTRVSSLNDLKTSKDCILKIGMFLNSILRYSQ